MAGPDAPSGDLRDSDRSRNPGSGSPPPAPSPGLAPAPEAPPRPVVERIGLFGLALVFGLLFGAMAAAAFVGGEPFLGVLGLVGAFMTLWVGLLTLFKR